MKLLSLLLFLGCATTSSAWYEVSPSFEKQKWRLCTKEKDGEVNHLKGLCYIAKSCRKRFMRKDYCKPLPKFCSFNDEECIRIHAYSNKFLMKKGR